MTRIPNPDQPDRCPSMCPYGDLQCARRVHEDEQCHFGGIAWQKGDPLTSAPEGAFGQLSTDERAAIRTAYALTATDGYAVLYRAVARIIAERGDR